MFNILVEIYIEFIRVWSLNGPLHWSSIKKELYAQMISINGFMSRFSTSVSPHRISFFFCLTKLFRHARFASYGVSHLGTCSTLVRIINHMLRPIQINKTLNVGFDKLHHQRSKEEVVKESETVRDRRRKGRGGGGNGRVKTVFSPSPLLDRKRKTEFDRVLDRRGHTSEENLICHKDALSEIIPFFEEKSTPSMGIEWKWRHYTHSITPSSLCNKG